MNTLQIGFARHDITPPLGVTIGGSFEPPKAIEILDPLEATALAVADSNGSLVLMLSLDILMLNRATVQQYKAAITEATGVPGDQIFIHCTHTHNGPSMTAMGGYPLSELNLKYREELGPKLAAVCAAAISDRKPAKMGWTVGKAPNVAFIRRFRMKDGSVRSNPGINNPDILEPLGEIDDRVNILRFDREGAKTIVLVNFGNHPCVVNGPRISADWPAFMRRTVEAALPECQCVFFNGAQGDVNHVNVHPGECDRFLNYEPDECWKEVRHSFAVHMGRAMAGTVLQEYDKLKYIDVDRVCAVQKVIQIPTNRPTEEELVEARRIRDMLHGGQAEQLHKEFPGMLFETACGESSRMLGLEHGPDFDETELNVIAIGNVAFAGFPGEPFTSFSFAVKEAPGWDMILPTCLINDTKGYFAGEQNYAEGGYETASSRYKPGTLENLAEQIKEMLAKLR